MFQKLASILDAIAAWLDGWRPIKTAPKDRSLVDLWLQYPDGKGRRATDCHWWKGWQQSGRWIAGRKFWKDGKDWYDPEDESHPDSIRATHWRLPPTSPFGHKERSHD